MFLLVGLGNPGANYRLTKHNFGFWIIDKLVEQRSLKYKLGKGDYVFALDNDCMFLKPTSFMNNSGVAIKQAMSYYKNIDDIIIIYDDIDIDLGQIRFRPNGSDGGHNGLKSISQHMGTNDYFRLRIGIGRPVHGSVSDHVLSDFRGDDLILIENVYIKAEESSEENSLYPEFEAKMFKNNR